MLTARLTPTLQTLFADFVQQLENAPVAGTAYTRERDGIAYHYAKIPVGNDRIDSFIGRVGDPVAEAQVAALKQGMEQAKERRRTVSMLKSGGLASPGRILGATLDAVAHAGLFQDGAVLVGTAAYMLSGPLVGHRLPAATLMTGDMDLATLNLALRAVPSASMEAILRRADPTFSPVLGLDPRRPACRFRNRDGYLVDLVTQARSRSGATPVPLEALEAGAEPLQHLAWLIEDPLRAAALWRGGILVTIPQPARLAVHKLILAQRRHATDKVKRAKDLAQADALMTALRVEDPFALEDALEDARAQGKSWSTAIDRSLAEAARP